MNLTKNHQNQNLLVLFFQLSTWFACISVINSETYLLFKIGVMIFFCLMMQGVFSLMHECYHDLGHSNKRVNTIMALLTSTIFGSSATLFKINHIGHHYRNRTRHEIIEFVYPDESRLKKTIQYYFGVLGGIWLLSFIGLIVLPFTPFSASKIFAINDDNNTYSDSFNKFSRKDWLRMKGELVFTILFFGVFIYLFSWKWQTLLICYACFAFSWSSLQWVYHMRTPLDVTEGTYNLRLPTPIRWLFLNFNYNLTHHREPNLPWQDLYKVSSQKETQPLWYRYFLVFKAPEPFPDDLSLYEKKYF
jgi:fatty acid desaturase